MGATLRGLRYRTALTLKAPLRILQGLPIEAPWEFGFATHQTNGMVESQEKTK
jgi:hypothetical protein